MTRAHLRESVLAGRLSPAEADDMAEADEILGQGFGATVQRVWGWITDRVTPAEFTAACEQVRGRLDRAPAHPEDAAETARRMIEGYLDVDVRVAVPRCDQTGLAILVVHAGAPKRGLFFSRAFDLPAPRDFDGSDPRERLRERA